MVLLQTSTNKTGFGIEILTYACLQFCQWHHYNKRLGHNAKMKKSIQHREILLCWLAAEQLLQRLTEQDGAFKWDKDLIQQRRNIIQKKKKGVLFIFMQVIKWVKKYSFFFSFNLQFYTEILILQFMSFTTIICFLFEIQNFAHLIQRANKLTERVLYFFCPIALSILLHYSFCTLLSQEMSHGCVIWLSYF